MSTNSKTPKPLLLLDVDGVLCPFGNGWEPPKGYRRAQEGYNSLWISDRNSAHLKSLADQFQLIWATMWEDEANDIIAPLHDLPPMPYIKFREFLAAQAQERIRFEEHYKLGAVKEFVTNQAFAWVDDDIDQEVIRWATEREEPTLVVPADPCAGFTDEIAQNLHNFAVSLNP